ncbi:MAG: prepilin-type N-terminal cleavage/methylation domain-containing protein [Candidatus Dependentiae bacterium]|nr:prepilin-type N-terminal cleavage/methylation domain-containing protein [Candidatus Dependentiae bacterium]
MENLKKGFSLIELMVVVAIIGLLSMIAVPSFGRYLAKAKRAEAYLNLNSIYSAEKAYWAEHGTYSKTLMGENSLGWQPEKRGANQPAYYAYTLSPNEDGNGFIALATGDIDGDGKMDVVSIDQNNMITIVEDDLA